MILTQHKWKSESQQSLVEVRKTSVAKVEVGSETKRAWDSVAIRQVNREPDSNLTQTNFFFNKKIRPRWVCDYLKSIQLGDCSSCSLMG